MIITGFSDDIEQDAKVFAGAGILGAEELASIFNKRKKTTKNEINPEESEKTQEESKKKAFLSALDKELLVLAKNNRISPEEIQDKKEAAQIIETGFSDNPQKDALIFAGSGIFGTEELVAIFNQKQENVETEVELEEDIDDEKKAKFLSALDKELIAMTKSGEITEEQVTEKIKSAKLIKTNFSDDPKKDAWTFARAGINEKK